MKSLLILLLLALSGTALAQDPSEPSIDCDALGMLNVRLENTDEATEPPVKIYLVSPSGKRFGEDPKKGKKYDEIYGSRYTIETLEDDGETSGKVGLLQVCNPEEGVYKLTLTGTAEGRFDVEIEAVARDDSSTQMNSSAIPISEKQEERFSIRYYNRPGEQVKLFKESGK